MIAPHLINMQRLKPQLFSILRYASVAVLVVGLTNCTLIRSYNTLKDFAGDQQQLEQHLKTYEHLNFSEQPATDIDIDYALTQLSHYAVNDLTQRLGHVTKQHNTGLAQLVAERNSHVKSVVTRSATTSTGVVKMICGELRLVDPTKADKVATEPNQNDKPSVQKAVVWYPFFVEYGHTPTVLNFHPANVNLACHSDALNR